MHSKCYFESLLLNVELLRWQIVQTLGLVAMATSNEEIEEELAAIDAILNDGLKVEHRKEDGRPVSVTYQVSWLDWCLAIEFLSRHISFRIGFRKQQ